MSQTLPRAQSFRQPTLITGGAGFIGTHIAHRLLARGEKVLIYDNLSRAGVEHNLNWLDRVHAPDLEIEIADIRDTGRLRRAVGHAGAVIHLAAQVAVTNSIVDPAEDFAINAGGTFHLLEILRAQNRPHPLIFTSTSKVYGNLDGLALKRRGLRYEPLDRAIRTSGIGEKMPLDFRGPHGCSKGAADQYVLDYARIYKLPAVVLRLSSVYGPCQSGTEDQGWLAHFLIHARHNCPIFLHGDGCQVRDVLFVEDLCRLMISVRDNISAISGQAFNTGGGIQNSISLMELIEIINNLNETSPKILFSDWRTGDHKYYVSNLAKVRQALGWEPRMGVREGVEILWNWLSRNTGNLPVPRADERVAGTDAIR